MDKTYRIENRRLFLVEQLPEPLTRADAHLQIFDNYIENTRLRLRSVRIPETKEWNWLLQQRTAGSEDESGASWRIAEIRLDETEYHLFEQFEGREIRKNRYFYQADEKEIAIDVFLGDLWGLNMARVSFATTEEMRAFRFPFNALEVTRHEFFRGENLVEKKFADVQDAVAGLIENE